MSASMSTPQTSSSDVQEHIVRVPRERKKKYSMMKIGSGVDLDFVKLQQAQTSVRIERENNFKEFKSAYDIDTMPKFGAGSEFGREQKEEARRKKYGIRVKKYNPDDQPWMLKIGQGKNMKKYKGVREGTIADNTSYYIFTKCPDGAFEAVPVEEWNNYTPQIRYKYLNSEEAEEEFSRRDKTLNYFNIMVKKRLRNDAVDMDDEGSEKMPKGSKRKGKDFKLTDQEDWAELSDDDEEEEEDREDGDAPKNRAKKGKGKPVPKRKKNSKHNSDDEAIEESDEGDYDDREVDYMSDSGSESEVEDKEKGDKYEEKGVDEEAGLRKLIDSGEEDEEEEENKEEENDDEKEKDSKAKKTGSDSDSSSSSSDSDSDIEKDDKLSSALFMQKGSEKKKGDKTASPKPDERGVKRKMDGESSSVKKSRTDSPLTTQGSGGSSEGITEDAIRRYLMRKPMTTKDLLQKFRSKKLNMTNEQMTHTIAQLLKKINPDKKIINKVMYLSIKSD
ncbi:general transcription factor IIF subunit 1-like [Haliotis rubra]|uniref:general transcription factor IIF subunit 1-like n=1 Tax=Haliotis rubra TaxID=36100 RepID=UPI001EE56EFF|nr:general transcription factor IIF subunit 1-like [Haliotis rubra]